jgi:hypothetical protein
LNRDCWKLLNRVRLNSRNGFCTPLDSIEGVALLVNGYVKPAECGYKITATGRRALKQWEAARR